MLPVGFAFGILEITITAFATDEGHRELAGVLLTLWAVASAAGGLVYGARPRRGTASDTHLRVALALPLGLAPIVLATSPWTMALLVIPAGIFIAPLLATRNELAGPRRAAGNRDGGLHVAADGHRGRDRRRRRPRGRPRRRRGLADGGRDRGWVRGGRLGARAGAARDVAAPELRAGAAEA